MLTLAAALVAATMSTAGAAETGPTVSLASFGAVGDGKADDTAAIQDALNSAREACVDGAGREYRVRRTLRASRDVCLLNLRLVQDAPVFDTAPFIKGDCAVIADPAALIPCGDPAIGPIVPNGLSPYLSIRTLLIRPEAGEPRVKVTLRNVRIDRGNDPASGARSEAAGLWIQWADKVELENVEVTGAGKGFGVMIAHVSNLRARNLHIHDIVWAPYEGDAPLLLERVREQGWNTAPIREYRENGQDGAQQAGFTGVRVQEQLACLMIVESQRIVLENLRVERCLARFAEGDFPWQTDGVGIGQSSTNVRIIGNSVISDTWEGIDVVGGGRGVRDIEVADTTIRNSFAYGIKLGYDLDGVSIGRVRVSGAGLAGIVLYGAVRNARLANLGIDSVGSVNLRGQIASPWKQERAGILIEPRDSRLPADWPEAVRIDRVRIDGGSNCRSGVANITPVPEIATRLAIRGCETERLEAQR